MVTRDVFQLELEKRSVVQSAVNPVTGVIELTAGGEVIEVGGSNEVSGLIPNLSDATTRAANASLLSAAFAISKQWKLPAGAFWSDPFTITAPCTITGVGANNAYGPIDSMSSSTPTGVIAATSIKTTSATDVLITVLTTGVVLRDFDVVNSAVANPSAGAGIQFGNLSSVVTVADGFKMNNVSVRGFYTTVKVVSAVGWAITDCMIYDMVRYGIHIDNLMNMDESDSIIHGNQIVSGYRNPLNGVVAAIYIEGGGGVKIIGNKINSEPPNNQNYSQINRGIWIRIRPGQTGVFPITGNSIEAIGGNNAPHAALCVTNDAGGNVLWGIVFTGNECFSRGGVGAKLAYIEGASGRILGNVVVTNNSCYKMSGVELRYTDGCVVGANTFFLPDAGSFAVNLKLGNTNPVVYPSAGTGANMVDLQIDQNLGVATDTTNNAKVGSLPLLTTREMPACVISPGAYVSLYKLTLPRSTAGILKLSLTGKASGVGQFSSRWERLVSNDASGVVSVSNTGLLTDFSFSAGTTQQLIDVSFDVSTADVLIVKIRGMAATIPALTTTNPGVFNGIAQIDFAGMVAMLTRL